MKNYRGDRLYVNLGPSKVRRRLKGHGYGVKTVQSVGRNQAVIVHTATGRHLDELKMLFSDVVVGLTEAELNPRPTPEEATAWPAPDPDPSLPDSKAPESP